MKRLENKIYEMSEKLPKGTTQIQLTDNKELEIEGSKKIIEYDENIIIIELQKSVLKILGTGLVTTCYSSGFVTVSGCINSLEFTEV